MKVLIALGHSGFFRHFDTVVTHLCDEGHEVRMITRSGAKHDIDAEYQREMLRTLGDRETGSYDFALRKPRGLVTWRVRRLRGVMDYGHYFRFQHNSSQLAPRMARLCPRWVRPFFATRAGRRLVSSDSFMAAYRRLQASLPGDRALISQLRAENPDVVVACPYIYRLSGDVEYVRAAQKLGIPTVGVVASWDNLSTKGTFPLLPDAVVVWNEGLAKEARTIHALPRDSLVVTGAAKFDHYFEMRPSEDREPFCRRLGLDPDRPYLLYIGSSQQVAGDETGFVSELEAALQADPRTRDLQIVVRPHPLNGEVWQDFEHERILVHPRGGQRPDIPGPRDEYFHTLRYSAAVAGVNTSAFLEAAIADRPCLSIVSERHREGQVERGHFQHLLKGRFIETVPDFDGAVSALAAIVEGQDTRQGLRRRFVESFVRPGGIDRRAGEVVAEAIVETATIGVRVAEPILPAARAAIPKPERKGGKVRPPTMEDERHALLRIHDEHPVPVRQPLVLIGELGGGGDLLNRLLDGHPAIHGHPHVLGIGHPRPEVWPQLDLDAAPDAWLEALREPLAPVSDNGGPGEEAPPPFLMVPSLQRRMFERCVQEWRPDSRRAVLDCYLTSYFNGWLDYQNLYGTAQRWVAAFGGPLALGEDNQRAFVDDYPDGRLVLVVSQPDAQDDASQERWAAAAQGVLEAKSAYGERLLVVARQELERETETAMRRLAEAVEIDFEAVLCTPTLNRMAAPPAAREGATDSPDGALDPHAGELYRQLLSAA